MLSGDAAGRSCVFRLGGQQHAVVGRLLESF